ncbi:DUF2786 domain-containing protein [Streptomyces smyrnaeus]|uniref:DUF2786 domain-containing protein n=1 Tax=Streptomyces smyrnaeus TaxID=1387713 RepID=UPI0033AD9602
MSTENKQVARIRALLKKAEDPGVTPEEAEAYFGKAAELMAIHGIEEAMLAEAAPETDRLDHRSFDIKGTYIPDRPNLLFAISHALGAQNVYWRFWDNETGKHYRRVKIYAHRSTLDRIGMLFTSLQLQALNGMKKGRPQYGESTTAYRKSWMAGFSSSVRRRLVQAEEGALRETAERGGTGAELVLVRREAAVVAYFKQEHPKVKTAPRRRLSGTGWRDGRAAGDTVSLGSNQVGGARGKALPGRNV